MYYCFYDPLKCFNINGRLIPRTGIMVKKFGRKSGHVTDLPHRLIRALPLSPSLSAISLSFFLSRLGWNKSILSSQGSPLLLNPSPQSLPSHPAVSHSSSLMAGDGFWQRVFQRFINRWLCYPTVSFIIFLGPGEL